MAPAAEDTNAPAASASGRRGRRQLGWAAVLCFGSHGARGEDASGSTSRARRTKRTVPVDGEVVARPADCEARRGADEEEEAGKGPCARGCCFLPPARGTAEPVCKDSSTKESVGGGGSNMNRKRRQRDDQNPASQAPNPQQAHQTRAAPSTTTAGSTGAAEARAPTRLATTPRDAARKNGESSRVCRGGGAFGSVVAAVSMAGLLGGRLWAVACVCAWLVALSRLRRPRRDAQVSAGGIARSDVAEVVDK